MGIFTCVRSKFAAVILVSALLAPSMAYAKPLTAETVHARIVKRGIGNWACVQLQTGVAFTGRIVRIDDQSFGMQLHNDPAITPVLYSDVVDLRTGLSRGAFWAIAGAGIGGMVAMGLIAHHEFEANKPQFPNVPSQPAF
jgi:hypothetical protein